MFPRIFSLKWLLTTILVIAAVAVMIRLGFWQLDRLDQRREFNARVLAQVNQPTLDLQSAPPGDDLTQMEYRKVRVIGTYDFSQEVALRNQALNGQWGVHLITPLRIKGSDRTVLVDRGWIPGDDFNAGDWAKFAEQGEVMVEGIIRNSKSRPDFGRRSDPTPSPGQDRLTAWNFVNVAAINQQIPYSLLPIYIQQAPHPAWGGMPIRTQPKIELTEGSHLGYAFQWFAMAAILGFGYPFFLRRMENDPAAKQDGHRGIPETK